MNGRHGPRRDGRTPTMERSHAWSQRYASGAVASRVGGNLHVAVPDYGHTSTVRAAARVFARSVWGERADVLERLGTGYSLDADGVRIDIRRYSVVIVGSAADYAQALWLAEDGGVAR